MIKYSYKLITLEDFNLEDINKIKNLKGIKNPKKVIIKSLSDYIENLSKLEAKEYYFRGEAEYYDEIMASGLRNGDIDYKTELPFHNIIKEYYNEVGQRISSVDREAFTAFSQHHGIPTNLIDITTSPLIAIYFACLDNRNTNNDGYIYLLNKKGTVDITDLINKEESVHVNIIDILSSKNSDTIKRNYLMFRELFLNNINLLMSMLNKLIDDYKFYGIDDYLKDIKISFLRKAIRGCSIKKSSMSFSGLEKDVETYIEAIKDKYYLKLCDTIISICKRLNIRFDIKIASYEENFILLYYLLLKNFLLEIEEIGIATFWFNCMPIFTYNPITEFQRIKNQQGLFIHQAYQIAHESIYDTSIFVKQRIWPDKVFVIKNKKNILKQLDNLGINEKFVFYDFDHIANYIKNNKR